MTQTLASIKLDIERAQRRYDRAMDASKYPLAQAAADDIAMLEQLAESLQQEADVA